MHELSIAVKLIEAACEAAATEDARRITKLCLQIGRLSGVVEEALRFSFELAAEGTPCKGAALEIEDVPVMVLCPHCNEAKTLEEDFLFLCPTCGTPTPQILSGQEMELISLEVDADETACP